MKVGMGRGGNFRLPKTCQTPRLHVTLLVCDLPHPTLPQSPPGPAYILLWHVTPPDGGVRGWCVYGDVWTTYL